MSAIEKAAAMLREEAEAIKKSHTLRGDWRGDPAEGEYHKMIAVADAAIAERDALHKALARHHAREMGEGRDPSHSLTKLLISGYQQTKLFADTVAALEGAPPTRTPEKLCYDSRWEVSIDYVDGWNAAVDMMHGKSPSWHCPDCCIAFPFGAPKSCPHDDARCNRLLAAPEAKP